MSTKPPTCSGVYEQAARQFVGAVSEAKTCSELNDILIDRIGNLGYQTCGYRRIFGEGKFQAAQCVFGVPVPGWSEHYQACRYSLVDPIVGVACRTSGGFTLEEVAGPSPEGAPILADARSFGLYDGFVAPVRGGYDDMGYVMIGSDRPVDADPYERLLLQGMCDVYGRAGLALLARGDDPPPLTNRESQCLRWVAAGRSDPQIGMILGLSANTIHAHVESAKTKLGANSRAQLVLRAVMAGILRSEAY